MDFELKKKQLNFSFDILPIENPRVNRRKNNGTFGSAKNSRPIVQSFLKNSMPTV